MVKTELIPRFVKEEKPVSIVCDVCKKEYTFENDMEEIQEIYSIRNTGGYGAVYGDGNRVELDICQHCFQKLLGEYVRVYEDQGQEEPIALDTPSETV